MRARLGRRAALAALAAGLSGVVAGCSGGPSFPDADVVVGPEGRLDFEPAELTVTVGEPVTWGFASSGHNVCGRPAHSDTVVLPAGAAPFASYDAAGGSRRSTVAQGATYEHAFAVPGRYVYVCTPHVTQGMVGSVRVGEPG